MEIFELSFHFDSDLNIVLKLDQKIQKFGCVDLHFSEISLIQIQLKSSSIYLMILMNIIQFETITIILILFFKEISMIIKTISQKYFEPFLPFCVLILLIPHSIFVFEDLFLIIWMLKKIKYLEFTHIFEQQIGIIFVVN